MSLRFIVGLCAIIVGAFSVTTCQPPTPRYLKAKGRHRRLSPQALPQCRAS